LRISDDDHQEGAVLQFAFFPASNNLPGNLLTTIWVDKKMGLSSMLVLACGVLLAARVVSIWCLLVVRQVLYPPASCFLPNGDIIGKPVQDNVDQKNTRLLLDHRMTRPSNDGHDPPPAAARRRRSRRLNLIIFSKGHNIYTTTKYCCCCDLHLRGDIAAEKVVVLLRRSSSTCLTQALGSNALVVHNEAMRGQ
jgi:hypothetical protein